MGVLLLQPTTTAQWQSLVKDAESSSNLRLNNELESYLVFLLGYYKRINPNNPNRKNAELFQCKPCDFTTSK